MPLSIQSNAASLSARSALENAQGSLQRTVARLSSGLRLNTAADDAAGLAIASRMTTQIRGTAQAQRNAGDALSLLQTADSALASMTDRLQRTRELALQARNGTLSGADRAALDLEVQQQLRELDRSAASAAFNGKPLLDGTLGLASLQVGAGTSSSDLITLDASASLRSAHIGQIATATSADLRTLNGAGGGGFYFAGIYTTVPFASLDFSRPDIPFAPGHADTMAPVPTNYAGAGQAASFTVDGLPVVLNFNCGSLAGVAAAVQAQLNASQGGAYAVSQDGVHLSISKTAAASGPTAPPALVATSGANAAAFGSASPAFGQAAAANTHAGFKVDGHRVALTADHTGNAPGLVADLQQQLDAAAPGVYSVSGSASGISIQHTSGTQLPRVDQFTDTGATAFARSQAAHLTLNPGDFSVQLGSNPSADITGDFYSADELAQAVQRRVPGLVASIDPRSGTLNLNASETLTLGGAQAGSGGSLAFAAAVNLPSGSLDTADVKTARGAGQTVLRVDAALDAINRQRGSIGALQSRLNAIFDSQQEVILQTSAARSRIVDADYAAETAALSREQILRQSGLAMLAQANAHALDVLSLLR
jgi:flagellin